MTGRAAAPARALLGRAVVLALLAGVAAVCVAAATEGRAGLRGALLAVGLVLGFLLVGQVPVGQAARGRKRLAAALLLLLYTTRVALLLVAFRAFYVSDDVDREILGLTVIACALAWTAGTVWSALRWRPMVVDPTPSEPPPAAPEPARERW